MTDAPALLLIDSASLLLEDQLPLLRELGYACIYLPSIRELRDPPPAAEMVLVGSDLPGGPGGEAFSRLRALLPEKPLLVLAHVRSLSTAIEFFRAGATDYLPLPVRPEEMRARLAAAARRLPGADGPEEVEGELVEADADEKGTPAATKTTGEAETVAAEEGTPPAEPPPGPAPDPAPDPAPAPPAATGCGSEAEEGDTTAEEEDAPATTVFDADHLPCGLLLLSREGKLIEANAEALALLGQETREALAELLAADPVGALEPRDLRDRAVAAESWPLARALREKGPRKAALSILRPDRTRIWLRIEAAPRLEKGRLLYLAATLTNITEEMAEARRRKAPPSGGPARRGKKGKKPRAKSGKK